MSRFYKLFFLLFFVLYLSHLLYWKDYWKPEIFFWDENYHIASAARYLKGIFFMEPHPPLGKLLIALGEWLLKVNGTETYGFENYDIIPHQLLDRSFSFAGYRFFPALFSVFNVLLFSSIVLCITQSYLFTAALCALPLLDTALLLHSRGAMLDSFLIFGHLLCILAFLILLKADVRHRKRIALVSFTMAFGFYFAFMTKVFGLALVVLWPLIYYHRTDLRPQLRKLFIGNVILVGALSLATWTVHIQLGKKISPTLMFNGEYLMSPQYEAWLLGNTPDSWLHLPQKLYEQLRYIPFFQSHVNPLDPADRFVTGSYPISWPFGSLPIPYRWAQTSGQHRYLYLVPNPWAWGLGLAGLLLSLALWIRRGKSFVKINPQISSLLILYFAYWFPMLFIPRVLYLYHYFPMLFISWILVAMLIQFASETRSILWNQRFSFAICLVPLLLFHGYFTYRNFAFYFATDCQSLRTKNVIPFWGLRYPTCQDEQNLRIFRKEIAPLVDP